MKTQYASLIVIFAIVACSEKQPIASPATVELSLHETKPKNDFKFFGVATLKEDNQICLQMRSEEPGKPIAEIYVCYKETDPEYKKIRDHVGAISVGDNKEFGPFEQE